MKNNLWKGLTVAIAGVASSSIITSIQPAAATFIYRYGDVDNFLYDPLEDSTYQRPEAKDWFENVLFQGKCNLPNYQLRCSMRQFDEGGWDRDLLHSFVFQDIFTTQPNAQIVSATFKTKLKSLGSDNDGIRLSVFGDPTTNLSIESNQQRHWYSRITSLTNTNWSWGETLELELDLSHLVLPDGSTRNLLQAMQEGFLDVQIQDDTVVDYIELEIETETVPEPASVAGLAILGLGFIANKAGWGRKKQQDNK